MYLANRYIQVKFDTVEISLTKANDGTSGKGGAIAMTAADMLTITNSLVQDTEAETSTILYSTAQTVDIIFSYNTFICDNDFSADGAYTEEYLDQDEPVTTSSNGMQIENAVSVTSTENSYSQCGIGTRGGLFRLVSTVFIETQSEYFNIAASRGGVIFCQDC